MDTHNLKPGDPVTPCQEDPTLRVRGPQGVEHTELAQSVGYSSRGYVQHFLPDREVNLAQLNKALADVFGEPALRMLKMNLEIDPQYWMQTCGNPWSGNIYQYHFLTADRPPTEIEPVTEIESLREQVAQLAQEVATLKSRAE
jgi:hypothetical protein